MLRKIIFVYDFYFQGRKPTFDVKAWILYYSNTRVMEDSMLSQTALEFTWKLVPSNYQQQILIKLYLSQLTCFILHEWLSRYKS